KAELAMSRRQHRPTVQVPFFALGRKPKNLREPLRLETKKRGCGLLLLCHGITPRPALYLELSGQRAKVTFAESSRTSNPPRSIGRNSARRFGRQPKGSMML